MKVAVMGKPFRMMDSDRLLHSHADRLRVDQYPLKAPEDDATGFSHTTQTEDWVSQRYQKYLNQVFTTPPLEAGNKIGNTCGAVLRAESAPIICDLFIV